MKNAFFGKTCQNVRKRLNLKHALNQKQDTTYLIHPALENFKIINDNDF